MVIKVGHEIRSGVDSYWVISEPLELKDINFLFELTFFELTTSHQNTIKTVHWLIRVIHKCPCVRSIIRRDLMWRRQPISWSHFSHPVVSFIMSVSVRTNDISWGSLINRSLDYSPSIHSCRWSESLSPMLPLIRTAIIWVIFISWVIFLFFKRVRRIIFRIIMRIRTLLRRKFTIAWWIIIKRFTVPIKRILWFIFTHHWILGIIRIFKVFVLFISVEEIWWKIVVS